SQLRPACSQVFNLFYPSDPSAARLEPLLQAPFHRLPPMPLCLYFLCIVYFHINPLKHFSPWQACVVLSSV
ncbi:hypothetical protein CRUP_030837, partial [Coryphaenoides rupestris]